MSVYRRRSLLPASLLGLLSLLPLLPGCGGGGGGGGVDPNFAVVTLRNGPLTFGGQTNTTAIVGYVLTNIDTLQVFTSTQLDLLPGESLQVSVPSGSYSCRATYSDGTNEVAQSPGDPAVVATQPTPIVTFIH